MLTEMKGLILIAWNGCSVYNTKNDDVFSFAQLMSHLWEDMTKNFSMLKQILSLL
jgi:hypothetical protein